MPALLLKSNYIRLLFWLLRIHNSTLIHYKIIPYAAFIVQLKYSEQNLIPRTFNLDLITDY